MVWSRRVGFIAAYGVDMTDKKPKRWIVECHLETEGGGQRKSISRPLMKAQAEGLMADLREVGVASNMHQREYTEEELEQAELYAAMGREADHLGKVVA